MIGRIFLGRYEAQKLLGEGGMGKVYLAKQIDLGRPVVVKVMHDHIAADPKFRERFQRETILMARFSHANAVTLYDASLTDSVGPCIVMEYVKGVNLESLLQKNGRLSAGRIGKILTQLCDVLQAAHDEGIVHRDLKPANIMISEPETPKERVKVMDFGLAKTIDEAHARKVTDTTVDFAVGTPGYICPEQIRGEMMDHRGDLYSVGVLLFELLCGRLPFQGASSMDVLLAHATEDPPTFAELGLAGVISRAVEDVVRDCMAKDPAKRPQSARELSARFAAATGQVSGKRAIAASIAAVSEGTDSNPILLLQSADVNHTPTAHDIGFSANSPLSVPHFAPNYHRVQSPPNTPMPISKRDVDVLPFRVDAWMPESVAVMKLRGFVHDTAGDVIENLAGLIRVRLNKTGQGGALGWLGFGKKADGPLEVKLFMKRVGTGTDNRLCIDVHFLPGHPSLLHDESWRNRCTTLFVKLRGYLMA